MGNYLSFPLLCLTNLTGVVLGFGVERTKELIRARLLKINGDDIVFRCKTTEYQNWRSHLPEVGLVLEDTKTLIHPTVFTLNSTFFLARGSYRPRQIFFHRASSFDPPTYNPKRDPPQLVRTKRTSSFLGALSTMLSPFPGCKGKARAARYLLYGHVDYTYSAPLSLTKPASIPAKAYPSPWKQLFRRIAPLSPLSLEGPSTYSPIRPDGFLIPQPPLNPHEPVTYGSLAQQEIHFQRTPASTTPTLLCFHERNSPSKIAGSPHTPELIKRFWRSLDPETSKIQPYIPQSPQHSRRGLGFHGNTTLSLDKPPPPTFTSASYV
uniref:Putative RdRp n=1 Tax=Leucocoprinus ourmiavirus E TaxID=2592723 RepID=A0A7G3W8V2_9VIRU|nr:putative RdRp [Leucocoprinus ourmiavirus E]